MIIVRQHSCHPTVYKSKLNYLATKQSLINPAPRFTRPARARVRAGGRAVPLRAAPHAPRARSSQQHQTHAARSHGPAHVCLKAGSQSQRGRKRRRTLHRGSMAIRLHKYSHTRAHINSRTHHSNDRHISSLAAPPASFKWKFLYILFINHV